MSRLGLPVIHSGQKVIHLRRRSLLADSRCKSEGRILPSIEFSGRDNDDPVMPRRVVFDELADNITTQRSHTEDGEEFKRDDGGIGRAPAEINVCVIFPC